MMFSVLSHKRSSNHTSMIIYLVFFFVITFVLANQTQRDLSYIRLPKGFKIEVFAQVPNARSLVRSDKGTIFVSNRNKGSVYAIKDTDGDNKADVIKVIAQKMNMPNGIALKDGNLYVAEINRLLRYDDIENNLDDPKFVVIKDDFPTDRSHGWKFIAFGPDGKLYIPIGAPCNICDKGDPYATITRMNPDGTQFEIFARGVRNTVGFDWDPLTGNIWFTDNGRDFLGDDLPPDELNYAPTAGLHFGYPYCHGSGIKDPQFGTKNCSQFVEPKVNFEAHTAGLGVNFYNGKSFPQKYRGGMFIAQHGSWNRKQKIGYRVKFVKVNGDKVVFEETFADGWLQDQQTKGRPVDTQQLEDGSLLVSDDDKGLVYRIYYVGNEDNKQKVTQISSVKIQVKEPIQTRVPQAKQSQAAGIPRIVVFMSKQQQNQKEVKVRSTPKVLTQKTAQILKTQSQVKNPINENIRVYSEPKTVIVPTIKQPQPGSAQALQKIYTLSNIKYEAANYIRRCC